MNSLVGRPAVAGALLIACMAPAKAFGADSPSIHTLSYNILNADWGHASESVAYWQDRGPMVFSTISSIVPERDVIGLQEVNSAQFSQLKAAFPNYEICWRPAYQSKSTKVGNAIMFKRARFDALGDCQAEALPNEEKPGGGLRQSRNFVWIELRDNADADLNSFIFMCTHFAHDSAALRLASANAILSFLTNLPVILVGDFNAHLDPNPVPAWWSGKANFSLARRDAELLRLTEDRFNNVVWNALGESDVPATGLASAIGGSRIDHVFASKEVSFSASLIAGTEQIEFDDALMFPVNGAIISVGQTEWSFPSDHFAVGASLSLPDRESAARNAGEVPSTARDAAPTTVKRGLFGCSHSRGRFGAGVLELLNFLGLAVIGALLGRRERLNPRRAP